MLTQSLVYVIISNNKRKYQHSSIITDEEAFLLSTLPPKKARELSDQIMDENREGFYREMRRIGGSSDDLLRLLRPNNKEIPDHLRETLQEIENMDNDLKEELDRSFEEAFHSEE